MEGALARKALELANDIAGYSPHSAHIYYTAVRGVVDDPNQLSWVPEIISQGKSFISKSITASDSNGAVKMIMNCSFVVRNSYRDALASYEKYTQLIKQRRAEGKTEDDDEDDGIRRVDNPMTIQVPFPEIFKDMSSMRSLVNGNIEYKLEGHTILDFKPNSYYDVVHFAARLIEPGPNLFANLAQLSSSIDVLQFNIGHYHTTVLERVIFFHDNDLENGYFIFQGRIVGFENRTLLLEFEVFNERGVHVATMHQVSDLRKLVKI